MPLNEQRQEISISLVLMLISMFLFFKSRKISHQTKLILFCIMIVFTVFFLSVALAATAAFDFTANQKYSYTGKKVISMANQMQISGSEWLNIPAEISITLPQSISILNSSRLKAMVTFGEFQTKNISDGIPIGVTLGLVSATQIGAFIYTYNPIGIQKLTIFYAVFLHPEIYDGNFEVYEIYDGFGINGYYYINSDPGSEYLINYSLPSAFNKTGAVRTVIMLSGLYAIYANINSQTIDFSLTGNLTSSTQVVITITSSSTDYTYLGQIQIKVILINIDFVNSNASSIYRIYDGSFAVTDSASSKFTSSYQMTSINAFVGLKTISINHINSFSFYLSLSQPNTISVSSDLPFSSYNSIAFVFIIFLSSYCDYAKPYYSEYYSGCFDKCLNTSNDTTLMCQCYYQEKHTEQSNCIHSIQPSSSSTIQLRMMIGVIIGAVVLIIIIILIIVKVRSSRIQNQNLKTQIQKQFRTKIYFDAQKDKSIPPSVENVSQMKIQGEIIQQPQFHPTGLPKQYDQSNLKKTQWKKCNIKPLSDTECSICKLKHSFLLTECNHYFHLKCMSIWLATNPTCPNCRANTKFQFKLYCNLCMLANRNILIGSEPIDETKIQTRCEDCQEVPP